MFASSVVAVLALVPFVVQSAFAADCARSYTVQQGDICDSISAANNVSTYQLTAVNPQIDAGCDNLLPGETLCLGFAGEDCATTYVVKPDDTCELVTNAHSINSTLLYANNPQIKTDCTNLYIGEVLCVASVFGAPLPPSSGPATTIPPSSTPAVSPTVSISVSTPSPSSAQSSPTVVTASVSLSSAVVTASASISHPASSASASISHEPSSSPVANSSDNNDDDDDDDDDIPFCDEL